MGRRREPRIDVRVPVRIFGTDMKGAIFSEKVVTFNVSHSGVQLAGVEAKLVHDEILGLTYGANRAHFRVKWIGAPGTEKSGHMGLLNIAPEKPLWDFPLPAPSPDPYQISVAERRTHPRFRSNNSVEIHVHGGASFWGTIADLSLGGCYVEMPIPLPPGTGLRIGIWIEQAKIEAEAEVTHITPGMGIGVNFTEISDAGRNQIRAFLEKLTPLARKRGTAAQS